MYFPPILLKGDLCGNYGLLSAELYSCLAVCFEYVRLSAMAKPAQAETCRAENCLGSGYRLISLPMKKARIASVSPYKCPNIYLMTYPVWYSSIQAFDNIQWAKLLYVNYFVSDSPPFALAIEPGRPSCIILMFNWWWPVRGLRSCLKNKYVCHPVSVS